MNEDAIAGLLSDGLIVRAPALSQEGFEYGVYATAAAVSPDHLHDLPDAMIGFLFDGKAIYHRQYAAMRHGLTTSLTAQSQILLPAEVRVTDRPGLQVTRTRRPAALTEGIEEIQTSFGISMRITSRARTVIDLFRSGRRLNDDWRHGTDALATYLGEDGDPAELSRLSFLFEGWLPQIVQTALDVSRPGYSP